MNLLLRHILWGVLMITLSLSSLYAQPKIVGSNYKYGVIDIKTGTQICDTIYNSITIEGNRIKLKDRNGWGIMNFKGEIIIPTKYLYIEPEKNGLTKVSMASDGKVVWGAYDSIGNVVVPIIYEYDALKDAIEDFQSQMAMSHPPIINLLSNTIAFRDDNSNNAIDANESCEIVFSVVNNGRGPARNCVVRISSSGEYSGISVKDISVPFIDINETVEISVPIKGTFDTKDGQVAFNIKVDEPNGFGTDPFTLSMKTKAFEAPLLKVTDYALTGTTGNLQKKIPFNLQLLVQNVKHGEATDVKISISVPHNVFILDGESNISYASIPGGKVHSLEYSLVANNNYTATSIPINVTISERFGKYAESRTINLDFNQVFASNKISLEEINQGPKKDIEIASLSSEVDKNIPVTGLKNDNTFAIIIANENYQNDAKVDYALNDGRIFKEYCLKTLGIPESNIKLSPDATLNNLRNNISWIKDVASVYKGEAEIIFYYAGHGVPDDSSKEAFLLPVDGDGRLASQTGYSLKQLYSDLASCNTKSTLVFMDACFSGAQRNGQMLASARGVVIKAKDDAPQGNMVVFSAASAEQTAHQFADKQHGMFTYFLLKKLQETNGNVTLGDLGSYLIDNVSRESIVRNSKLQTPTVTPSSIIGDWTNIKL